MNSITIVFNQSSKLSNRFFTGLVFLPVSAISLLVLWGWLKTFPFGLVDDAYIPMVYARHLARGLGIVFEPGGERVEGYSSPLWMLSLAVAALLKIPLPAAAYGFGLAGGVLALCLVPWVYDRAFGEESASLWHRAFWPCMAGLAVVADAAYVAWSASGMETLGYSAVLLGLVYLLLENRGAVAVGLGLLLLAAVRPEGALFLVPVIGIWIRQRQLTGRRILQLTLSFGLPLLILVLFRRFYFGYWLPNSFYAKHDFGGWILFQRGGEYLATFFRPRLWFLFAVLGWLADPSPARRRGETLFLFALTQCVAVAWEGGDHFALHRFLVPAIPLFSILSVRGIERVVRLMVFSKLGPSQIQPRRIAQAATALCVPTLFLLHGMQLFEYQADDRHHFSAGVVRHLSEVSWAKNWARMGKWLKEKYPPNTVIAVMTAGAIPFTGELRCVDILGINNTVIAHAPARDAGRRYPGHEKSDPDYVLGRRPRMIQLFPLLFFVSNPYPENKTAELITYPAQQDLIDHPQFKKKYRYKTDQTPYGFISYYERIDDGDGE